MSSELPPEPAPSFVMPKLRKRAFDFQAGTPMAPAAKPVVYISGLHSTESAATMNAEIIGGLCPWVRVGNVFTSLGFTGACSWEPMVRDLYNKGQRSFAVLCGRHGDQLGGKLAEDGTLFTREQHDAAIDPAPDTAKANNMNGTMAGMNVVVVDVGMPPFDNPEMLRTEIRTRLAQGRVVILSWCYSVYAMREGWKASTALDRRTDLTRAADAEQIRSVANDWKWALFYGTTAASNAAGAQARGRE